VSRRRPQRNMRRIWARVAFAFVLIFLLPPAADAAAEELKIELGGTGTGKVASEDGFINCSNIVGEEAGACSHPYGFGAALTVTAGPGSTFAGWTKKSSTGVEGTCTGTTNPCETGFLFVEPLTLEATFEPAAAAPIVKINPVEPPSAPCTSAPTATEACFSGEVNAEGGATRWRFEYRTLGASTWTKVPSPEGDAGNGTSFVSVSVTAGELEPNTEYEVRLVAKSIGGEPETGVETFTTPAGVPTVTTGPPSGVGATTATLTGTVNPRNSAVIACRFQLVPLVQFEAGGFASAAPDQEAPCVPAPGSGGAAVEVSAAASGLQPEAAYRYRLLATNVAGTADGGVLSLFTYPPAPEGASCPNSSLRLEPSPSSELHECRAYELVTSADKHGADAITSPIVSATHSNFVPLAVPGSEPGGVAWTDIGTGPNPLPDGGSENWYLSRRGAPSAWQVESAGRAAPAGQEPQFILETASADLSTVVLQETLVDFATGEKTVTGFWLRGANGVFTQVAPPSAAAVVAPTSFWELSPDGSHLLFATRAHLLGEDTTEAGARQLYEWTQGGGLRLAGLDSDGTPTSPCGATLAGSASHRESVSVDGSRVVFLSPDPKSATPESNRPAACNFGGPSGSSYVSDLYLGEGGESIDISRPPAGVPDYGASFVGATPDFSRVFFVTESALPDDDPSTPEKTTEGPGNADLYMYETASSKLTRLSVSQPGGEVSAGVSPNGGIALSFLAPYSTLVAEDGRAAYFLACGRLVPGQGRTCAENGSVSQNGSVISRNLYLWRQGAGIAYVTNLKGGRLAVATEGKPLRTEAIESSLLPTAAAVDHDGSALVFTSVSRLSGYDNRGTSALYRYDASTGQIDCVSCSPVGLPILGNVTSAGSAGRGPVFGTNFETGAALPSRGIPFERYGGLSADGSTVVFATTDQLLPQATNVEGVQRSNEAIYDLYAWRDGRLSLISTGRSQSSDFLIGTSPTGSDVYFLSSSQLSAQDTDHAYDIYDARVGGGFASPPAPPPPCGGVDCRGPVGSPPAAPGAASAAFAGEGNERPHTRRCGKRQVRRGKRCVSRRKPARHRARAHHRPAKGDRGGSK